jgi:hypothetical protein
MNTIIPDKPKDRLIWHWRDINGDQQISITEYIPEHKRAEFLSLRNRKQSDVLKIESIVPTFNTKSNEWVWPNLVHIWLNKQH